MDGCIDGCMGQIRSNPLTCVVVLPKPLSCIYSMERPPIYSSSMMQCNCNHVFVSILVFIKKCNLCNKLYQCYFKLCNILLFLVVLWHSGTKHHMYVLLSPSIESLVSVFTHTYVILSIFIWLKCYDARITIGDTSFSHLTVVYMNLFYFLYINFFKCNCLGLCFEVR